MCRAADMNYEDLCALAPPMMPEPGSTCVVRVEGAYARGAREGALRSAWKTWDEPCWLER